MVSTVVGLFEHSAAVENALGAFRSAGYSNRVLRVTKPGEVAIFEGTEATEHHGGWLREHLPHRSHAPGHVHADHLAEGPQLLTVHVGSELEERDARTLLITAGALQISNATDGTMVPVQRVADGVSR